VFSAHKDPNADFEDLAPKVQKKEKVVELPEAPPREACEEKGSEGAQSDGSKELVLARVLEDIPTFAGVDRDYKLKKEDIVSLPSSIANTLVSHGKIKLIGAS
jgi:DNA replication initiation complex subunit (GINS family)